MGEQAEEGRVGEHAEEAKGETGEEGTPVEGQTPAAGRAPVAERAAEPVAGPGDEGQTPTRYCMYVVECADGTWYTGYATDVAHRVATHNAGKGAKYTRSRLPVALVASAEFATRHEALSAEYHFKRMSRTQKETLVARAAEEGPLERVLAEAFELGGPDDGAGQEGCQEIDTGRRAF